MMVPAGSISFQPTVILPVKFEHEGCPFWRLELDDAGQVELHFAQPGFKDWCLDTLGGNNPIEKRRCILNRDERSRFFLGRMTVKDRMVNFVRAGNGLEHTSIGAKLEYLHPVEDFIPVYWDDYGAPETFWIMHRKEGDDRVMFENASPRFRGHYLTCANDPPRDARRNDRSERIEPSANPIVIKRLSKKSLQW
jgi:hypothetical protein